MALVKVSIDIFRIGNKLSNNKIKEINLLDALPYKEQKEEIESEIVENDSQSGKNRDTQIRFVNMILNE